MVDREIVKKAMCDVIQFVGLSTPGPVGSKSRVSCSMTHVGQGCALRDKVVMYGLKFTSFLKICRLIVTLYLSKTLYLSTDQLLHISKSSNIWPLLQTVHGVTNSKHKLCTLVMNTVVF